MKNFNIEIAHTVFRLECLNESLDHFYRDYITEKEAEFTVSASEKEIKETRESYEELHRKYGDFNSPGDATTETLVHHKYIAEIMLKRGVLLTHGSAVVANGEAYLFIAPSQTGKSTHTKLWLKLPDIEAFIINDDKPMLRPTKNGIIVYSTPWGQRQKPKQSEAPLKAIAILERGEQNSICPIGAAEMFPQLFKASLRGETRGDIMLATDLEDKILSGVKSFKLKCNMEPEAAQVAFQAMSN